MTLIGKRHAELGSASHLQKDEALKQVQGDESKSN